MSEANPVAKLLIYANSTGCISYETMTRWADEFGISRAELIDLYELIRDEGHAACASALQPSVRKKQSLDFRFDVLASAYSEGLIGLDRVLLWAEERELEDGETISLLERCAAEAHAI